MGEHKSKKQVTRRTFLKGSLALGAAVSLFGCTKPKDEKAADNVSESVVSESSYSYTPALTSNRAAGTVDGDIFWGATPHNCGGENCVLKAFVKDGAVKRIVTDERYQFIQKIISTTVKKSGNKLTISDKIDKIVFGKCCKVLYGKNRRRIFGWSICYTHG